VKKRPNRLGVTEGLRRSLVWLALLGDSRPCTGDDEAAIGLIETPASKWNVEGPSFSMLLPMPRTLKGDGSS
jgi:hypothetical protein